MSSGFAVERPGSSRTSEAKDLASLTSQNGDKMSSLSDSGSDAGSDDSDDSDLALEQHGDHLDQVYYKNPFESPGDEWNWLQEWVDSGFNTFANDQLYENPQTQSWLARLHSAHRENIVKLLKLQAFTGRCNIPLFEADNGDEYQLELFHSCSRLPIICCPDILHGRRWGMTDFIFEFQSRNTCSSDAQKGEVPKLPKFALDLGSLEIRTTATPERHYSISGERVTERTGYQIIVDVLGDGMPLWITAARRQLETRDTGAVHQRKSVYPIFKGLMIGENGSFDTACFLPSIHQLHTSKPENTKAMFQDACELVRKTRVSVDPVAVIVPEEKVHEYFLSNQTLLQELDIGFRKLLGGVKSRIWAFLGK